MLNLLLVETPNFLHTRRPLRISLVSAPNEVRGVQDPSYIMSEGHQGPIESLTPDEANRIIHSHRKVRYGMLLPRARLKIFLCICTIVFSYLISPGTACWPCRQRKVKCDNKQPCENCVKRDHASLCSYNPKQNAAKSASGSIAGVKRARSPGSESSSRKEDDRWPRTTGKCCYCKLECLLFSCSVRSWLGASPILSLHYLL